MWRALLLGLAVAGCGGATGNYQIDYAGPIALELVNQTSRPIEQIYIFPRGASNRGTSWTTLAPGATTTVKLREGMFELVAVSAKRRIDGRYRETPQATTQIELREDLASTPRTLIFHDAGEEPAGVDQPGTLGVVFMISAPEPAEPDVNADAAAPAQPDGDAAEPAQPDGDAAAPAQPDDAAAPAP